MKKPMGKPQTKLRKLTRKQVDAIMRLAKSGELSPTEIQIKLKLPVHPATVWQILKGLSYRDWSGIDDPRE